MVSFWVEDAQTTRVDLLEYSAESEGPPNALPETLSAFELFHRPAFAEGIVFRGGIALHELFFDLPGRYSEDTDLVQRTAGPIGPLADEIPRFIGCLPELRRGPLSTE